MAVSPFALMRDPRRGCGSTSPFTPSIGYGSAKGYQYSDPQAETRPQNQRKGFSVWDFLKETAKGGLTGGFTSAAFYGAGKGIERIKESIRSNERDALQSVLSLSLGEADDNAINLAIKNAGPSTSEEFRVFGHGSPNTIQYNGRELDARQVAELIRNSPQYIGGNQKVILYSCDTGRASNGFARQLADILDVLVEAPNRKLRPLEQGGFEIFDPIPWVKGGKLPGSWVQYEPPRH